MKGIGAILVILTISPFLSAAPCESLSTLTLPDTKITMAVVVPAGAFTPPPRPGPARVRGPDEEPRPDPYAPLPAFCRVAATLTPRSDSEIKIEVWLPSTGWNNKMLAVGNGAWAGSISYDALAPAVAAGYAAASTDTGHGGRGAEFLPGHPEKLIDFSHRAVHEMTVAAKAVIAAFYGNAPRLSYFRGCSTGGRQALTAAQRYPLDFDGIIAGATAINNSRLHAAQIWFTAQNLRDETSAIPEDKLPALHEAVLKACDALDGVQDRVIGNPRQCKFDPQVLLCKEGDAATCLTAAQAETVKRIYAGPGIFPGLEPGSEDGWGGFLGWLARPVGIAYDQYRYLVFDDPNWDFKTIDVQKDVAAFDKVAGALMNSSNPNLGPFFDRGGKLLMYHGWADPGIPAGNSVEYYSEVVKAVGEAKAANSIRLFMLPGVGHCSGGDGPSTFDAVGALDEWRDKGQIPASIPASHQRRGVVDNTRPLCPYPQMAQYKGTGSTTEAANFVCK